MTLLKALWTAIGMLVGLLLVLILAVVMVFYWMIGIPIEIKRGDVLVGTLQWFRYTKV